jgi:hypothetical protein
MLLYGSTLPEKPSFAPNARSAAEADRAADKLWDAERDVMRFRDNANAFEAARAEAYERRNRAIFEATGRQLENPYRASREALDRSLRETGATSPYELLQRRARGFADWRGDLEKQWQADVAQLAKEFPQHAGILSGPIDEDAYRVAREAEAAVAAAGAEGEAAGVGGMRSFLNRAGGSIAGAARDPLQIATLFAGGGPSFPAKFALGRIASTMLTEAAVNAGAEGVIQAASQDWRRKAGVESGLAPALEQVGIAALFGAGAGGLLRGGVEVFGALGRAAPEEALARIAAGDAAPGDVAALAEALGRPADDVSVRVAEIAAEQPALDRAAFGAALDTAEGERLAAEALRAAENPVDLPPSIDDAEERFRQAERIARSQTAVGRNPRKPVSLVEFLYARGGVLDPDGDLKAMGADRLIRDRSRAGSRGRGTIADRRVPLDMAREAAEEAGYIGVADGYQTTTVRDLLDAIDAELRGDPVYAREDAELAEARRTYEEAVRGRDEYRRLVGRVDSVREELGLDPLDDAVLIRATELVDDETDEAAALERAIEEDYRAYAERSGPVESSDADDVLFFDETPGDDAGAMRRAGGEAGGPGGDGDVSRGPGGSQAPGQQFPRAGGAQETEQPLRAAGDTPEPASPEAGEAAAQALNEVRGTRETSSGNSRIRDSEWSRQYAETDETMAMTARFKAAYAADAEYQRLFNAAKELKEQAADRKAELFEAEDRKRERAYRSDRVVKAEIDEAIAQARKAASFMSRNYNAAEKAVSERARQIQERVRAEPPDTPTEKTEAGEQALIPGVKPVSTREKLEAEGAKPLKGGDAAPPEGGLFDLEARKQLDIWDVMPAARTPEGKPLYTTHADMTAEAERTEFFSDLIKSCKE